MQLEGDARLFAHPLPRLSIDHQNADPEQLHRHTYATFSSLGIKYFTLFADNNTNSRPLTFTNALSMPRAFRLRLQNQASMATHLPPLFLVCPNCCVRSPAPTIHCQGFLCSRTRSACTTTSNLYAECNGRLGEISWLFCTVLIPRKGTQYGVEHMIRPYLRATTEYVDPVGPREDLAILMAEASALFSQGGPPFLERSTMWCDWFL